MVHLMRLILVIFLPLLSLQAFGHSTESNRTSREEYSVGRYSSVSTEPTQAQMDLLAVIIEIRFPQSINSVGQALENMLVNSGFRLAELSAADPSLSILLNSPLPNVHRSLGPVSLRTALNILSGASWDLIIDPVHRLVSFELKQDYSFSFENDGSTND